MRVRFDDHEQPARDPFQLHPLAEPTARRRRALRPDPTRSRTAYRNSVSHFGRVGGPGACEAAGDRVISSLAAAKTALPAETLLLDACRFGSGPTSAASPAPCAFTERVSTGRKRNSLLVIHRHAAKVSRMSLARSHRLRITVGPSGSRRSDPSEQRREDSRDPGHRRNACLPATRPQSPNKYLPRFPTSSRPPAKPNVLKPIDSSAQFPARIIRVGPRNFLPYFCLIGKAEILLCRGLRCRPAVRVQTAGA